MESFLKLYKCTDPDSPFTHCKGKHKYLLDSDQRQQLVNSLSNTRYPSLFEKRHKEGGPLALKIHLKLNKEVLLKDYYVELIKACMTCLSKTYALQPTDPVTIYAFEEHLCKMSEESIFETAIWIQILVQSSERAINFMQQQLVEMIEKKSLFRTLAIVNESNLVFQRLPEGLWPFDTRDMECVQVGCMFDWDIRDWLLETKSLHGRRDVIAPWIGNSYLTAYPERDVVKELPEEETDFDENSQVSMMPVVDVSQLARTCKSISELRIALEQWRIFTRVSVSEYDVFEVLNYVSQLPVEYGREREKRRHLCMAIKSFSEKMLLAYLVFCTDKDEEIDVLVQEWDDTSIIDNAITITSLAFWVRMSNPDGFEQVRDASIRHYVARAFDGMLTTDIDLAKMVYNIYKNDYVCASLGANSYWYVFKEHRWERDEKGCDLRNRLYPEIVMKYIMGNIVERRNMMKSLTEEQREQEVKRIKRIESAMMKIGNSMDKIMLEASYLFFNKRFNELLNANTYLTCFKNGVFDFKNNIFREGRPDDYLSFSMNTDYLPLEKVDSTLLEEIEVFLRKIFPEKEIYDYMLEHLASTMLGVVAVQTFNNYYGEGRNGKSILVKLMMLILGDYGCSGSLSLITSGRTKMGQASPDIVKLKNKRYLVLDEPEKGEGINEGALKTLTSGMDELSGRELYSNKIETFYPQLKLVICTNNLLTIKSMDYGTWRRVRVVDFVSLFTPDPDPNNPYNFKEENVRENFDRWKDAFCALLMSVAMRTKGMVKDCERVLESSNAYKATQDFVSQYIRDNLREIKGATTSLSNLNSHFDSWFRNNMDSNEKAPLKELHEEVLKKMKSVKKLRDKFTGLQIVYSEADDDDVPDAEDFK